MTAAEIKLDLFRRLDKLSDTDLENIYNKLLKVLANPTENSLNFEEAKAMDEDFNESEKGNQLTREEVIAEAIQKYSDLRFK